MQFAHQCVCVGVEGVAFWRFLGVLFLSLEEAAQGERGREMAQAMRAMAGSMAGCSLQSVDAHVALKTLKKVAKSSRTSFSVKASQTKKEEQKTELLAMVAPVTIASTVLASNAGVATALTGEDVTGAFYQVLNV